MCVACVLHVCCMCVACALHEQGHTNHIPELGKWDKRGRHKTFGWQARDFGSSRPPATLESTCVGLSHIADILLFWTMLMVALSIHFCGVVTGLGSVCFDNGYTCQKVMLSQRSVCVCVCVEKELETKNFPPGFFKKNSHQQETTSMHT